MTYVAFLRGINIGGKTVTMDHLKNTFESLGFTNVTTFLATGNITFDSTTVDDISLTKLIESKLQTEYGFEIRVLLRSCKYLKELVASEPFKAINVKGSKLYVSFLSSNNKVSMTIPYESTDKLFKIISATKDELFWVVYPGGKTTDSMTWIEKKFGKNITTRNWNTIKKL